MLTRIGKYEIRSEIGKGGFGRVYLAHDPSVDRLVAIKILTSQADPAVLGQFRAEAKTTGNLRHKNIVTVYDFGEHEGVPFLVMELLEGRNLQEVLEEGEAMSLMVKLHVLSQTAEGLHHAHRMGVVHRDVKPANIMLLAGGAVKIMDFGIANLVNLSPADRTRSQELTGTTRYMAPEQFSGAPAD
ncbi:MAG: serine/threonine protein kinase, partial [Bryobacteraceae bacterium]|nr:serine/threonine protein kinase [Bryobacteraceae bacterium]